MVCLKSLRFRRLLCGGLLLLTAIWPSLVRGQILQNGEEVLSSITVGGLALFEFDVDDASTVIVSVGETGGLTGSTTTSDI